ncbi:MAG: ATP synthase F0 subunit B [Pseudobdellovibrionaceae bacterium]|nr:ATP synthase F0 subunit B [Bdellovibrionales bacterium]USN46858.1 MAG: ATP synthase F0 subunit B [Pseudobdellovibrionaceae bacterium]
MLGKSISTYLVVFLSIVATPAWAASAHIPFSELILPQLVNVVLVILGLTFLTKKFIGEHFKARREQFTTLVRRASSALDEANSKQRKVKDRLAKLEENAGLDLQRVQSEAEELKRQIINDAKDLGLRLETEAHRSAQYEVDRAIAHLREDLLDLSVSEAEAQLKKTVDGPAQKRFQSEFVEKIQVVQ